MSSQMQQEVSQYFVSSPWDGQYIPIDNNIAQYIVSSNIQPDNTEREEGDTVEKYSFSYEGRQFDVIKANPSWVAFRNRVMDVYSYSVKVLSNNVYVVARPHQYNALVKYVVTNNPVVEVPHSDGGMFRATFERIDDNNFKYTREDGSICMMRREMIF
jgi:hypothetical protein